MRTTQVSHVLYLSQRPGRHTLSGIQQHLMALLPELLASGVDVELLILALDTGPDVIFAETFFRERGIRTMLVARSVYNSAFVVRVWKHLWCWGNYLKLVSKRQCRVIHIHLIGFESMALVYLAWIVKCKNIILSIHNDEPGFRNLRWRLSFSLANLVVNNFIVISNHLKVYCHAALGLPQEKITTIYYGVAPYTPCCLNRIDFGLSPNDFVVGYIGRFTPQKNLFLLVEALSKLPEVRGLLVGGGSLNGALKEYVDRLNVTNLTFTGPVREGRDMFQLMDLFCLPSLWEGFGLVLLEAMQQGIPIIGSNRGAISEILDSGRCGLIFDPTDVDSVVAAIREVQTKNSAARARAGIGQQLVQNRFSLGAMAASTKELYLKAADNCQEPLR